MDVTLLLSFSAAQVSAAAASTGGCGGSSIGGGNKEATGNESLPPSGYIVAGKMRLGSAISVPAPNSAHLRRDCKSQKLPPFRSESINSGTSSSASHFLPKAAAAAEQLLSTQAEIENSSSSISERESISPHRLQLPHEEVIKNSNIIMTDNDETDAASAREKQLTRFKKFNECMVCHNGI